MILLKCRRAIQNFSIFTSCSYYLEKEHTDLVTVPMSVITESSEHCRTAVFTCITTIISQIKDQMNDPLRKVFLWMGVHRNSDQGSYLP